MKKYLSLFLGLSLLIGVLAFNPTNSKAASNGNQGVIDLNNLDEQIENEEVTIKEITYEEMISKISESKGISEKQARKLHPNKANQITLKSGISTLASTNSVSLHEIKIRQQVKATYRPAIQLFVWTYNSGSFTQFNSIEEADLDRKDVSINVSKQFQGKLRFEITSPTKIWWYINGDFYDNGQTTISGTVGANGVVWNGSASISYSSSHFAYWNKSGTYSRY